MRLKAPFTIEHRRKGAIQFLRDANGHYLGQFNTHKGKRTGTFTTFLARPAKVDGRFIYPLPDGPLYSIDRVISKRAIAAAFKTVERKDS